MSWLGLKEAHVGLFIDSRLRANMGDNEAAVMDSKRSSKYRVRDVLPSVRPSYVSLILVFFCGFLWLKNEAANDRLLALESQLQLLSRQCGVDNDSPKGTQSTDPKPTAAFPTLTPSSKYLHCQLCSFFFLFALHECKHLQF